MKIYSIFRKYSDFYQYPVVHCESRKEARKAVKSLKHYSDAKYKIIVESPDNKQMEAC